MPFSFVCDTCGKTFTKHYQALKTGCTHRFCSRKCWFASNRGGRDVPCPTCGKLVYRAKGNDRRFCSRTCYDASRGLTVEKACVGCGCTFVVKSSVQDRYNYCSFTCKTKYRQGEWVHCKRCGKRFWHKGADIARGVNRPYCSEACRRPPVVVACKTCGTKFRTCPSETKRQFCSLACYRRSNSETSIEKTVRLALDSLSVRYTQEAHVGRYSVDFLIPSTRTALEVDGTYWHRDPARDRRKNIYLAKAGWTVCRITEAELANASDVDLLVRERLKGVATA